MLLRKRIIQKLAIGLACLLAASGVTLLIKDVLASRNPQSALPVITVFYDGTPLSGQRVATANYSWRFLNETKEHNSPLQELLTDMEYVPVAPGAEMRIDFSFACRDVDVSIAEGAPPFTPDSFTLMQETDSHSITGPLVLRSDNSFITPEQPGRYVYKVEADWSLRGSVMYVFKIEVVDVR